MAQKTETKTLDCPVPGCRRVGDKGYTTQGWLDSHLERAHKGFNGSESSVTKEPKIVKKTTNHGVPFAKAASELHYCPSCGANLARHMMLTAEGLNFSPQELSKLLEIVSKVAENTRPQ